MEKQLVKDSTVKEFLTVQKEENRNVEGKVKYYNLDMIISLGCRIKFKVATIFRKWVTERLKEYMIKGFTMNDERLKGNGGGNCWRELLARIKDIRSSEKYYTDKSLIYTQLWQTMIRKIVNQLKYKLLGIS